MKLSYERTCRLPSDRELFGDGDYEEGDSQLKPERSDNLNLNLSYDHSLGADHTLSVEAGFLYRHILDYIIRTISSKGTAASSNHGRVRALGLEFGFRYNWDARLTLGGNYTLQNLRDRERLTLLGAESVTFNNRVPNQPYAFGNAEAAYTFPRVFRRACRLTLAYGLRYIHSFARSWSGAGAHLYIPTQLSHEARLTCTLGGGRYNLTLAGENLADALLYDNYSLQKPGRSLSVKFRYCLYKQ